MLSRMTHLLKLSLVALKQPRRVLVRLCHEPQWPLVAPLAYWSLSKTEVNASTFITYLFPEGPLGEIERLLEEIQSDYSLYQHLKQLDNLEGKQPKGTMVSGTSYDEAELMYIIVRLLKPNCVVETGVAAGVSSTFILEALNRNDKGELYSIDLPLMGVAEDGWKYWRPAGKEPGWIIPDSLRHRWHLVLGSSQQVLVPLLTRLGEIDLFLHDSLHTFRNMEFEYQTAWRFIRLGGYLLSHDVGAPYLKFCRSAGTLPLHYARVGGVRKQG